MYTCNGKWIINPIYEMYEKHVIYTCYTCTLHLFCTHKYNTLSLHYL